MNPTLRGMLAALGLAAVVALGAASPAVALQQDAEPAATPAPAYTVSPAHVWVDPTGALEWEVQYFFDVPDTHWVVSGNAPAIWQVGPPAQNYCTVERRETGVYHGCRVETDAAGAPGEYTSTVRIRSEGGDDYTLTAPITVCPLTGCSPLFELALSSNSIDVCVGADLAALEPMFYEFNVAWNATLISIGDLDAAGDWQFVSEPPADGSEFALRGSFDDPGDYVLPITITDEFDGDHIADLAITVDDCSLAAPTLAATGADHFDTMIAWATGVIVAGLLAVVLVSCSVRRDSLKG